jgi:acetyl-CoA acetyltransferase
MTTSTASGAAIAGLGITAMGKVYGRSTADFALDAVQRACEDAGLAVSDLDGLLTNAGLTPGLGLPLSRDLGLRDLKLLSEVQGYGSSAGTMIAMAAMAIQAGSATTVACVFADAPLKEGKAAGAAYQNAAPKAAGFSTLPGAVGLYGANPYYALAARRHMEQYGTTSEQLGAIATSTRAWAALNPLAQMRTPITIEDHQASRMVADPLHLLDCCLVSNGGVAVVVTSAERAADLAQPPVHVRGWAQAHPGYVMERGSSFGLVSGAAQSGPAALEMAGVTLDDVDVREIYDCYTYTTLITLEDYGICGKGEGGALAESGALAPGGSLPTNTGGGQLSSYYMWGMTPMSEAVIQARGQGGERQVDKHDVVLVSGNGGVLDYHSTVVLGTSARA